MLLGTDQKRRRQRDGVVNLNAAVGQVEGHQIASFGGSSAILFAQDNQKSCISLIISIVVSTVLFMVTI